MREDDVAIKTPSSSLSVSRTHATFEDAGTSANNGFGPGWAASLGESDDVAGFQVADSTTTDGTISLSVADGDPLVFREPGGGKTKTPVGSYEPVGAPTAQSGYSLKVVGAGSDQRLSVTSLDGAVTMWRPIDASANSLTWVLNSSAQAADHSTESYTSDALGRITRILAPVPAGVTCGAGAALNPGCTALHIAYSSSTTPVPSGTSVGAYPGRISSIAIQNYDPETSGMATTVVASYAYDSDGRLSVFTDERRSLSTRYAYRVINGNTALATVTHDGLASYSYNYDTSAATPRLANVTRAAATAGGAAARTDSFVYSVPVGTQGLPGLSGTQVNKWGQTRVPTAAFAVFGQDHPVSSISASGIAEADWPWAKVFYADDDGYQTNTAEYGTGRWLVTAHFYDDVNRPTTVLGPKETFEAASGNVVDLSSGKSVVRYNPERFDGAGKLLVPAGTYVTDEWSPIIAATVSGNARNVRVHTHYEYDEGAPNAGLNPVTGLPYLLVTSTRVGVADPLATSSSPKDVLPADIATTALTLKGYDPIDGSSPTGASSGWTLGQATTSTLRVSNSPDKLLNAQLYNADGQVIATRGPESTGSDAGTVRTQFYSAAANTDRPSCGSRPAWAGLPCWTGPASAPESGVDIIDNETTSYTRWLDPQTVVETSGAGGTSSSRVTTRSFFPDGRENQTAVSVNGVGGSLAVPVTRVLYDAASKVATGRATLDSSGNVTSSVTSSFDRWGRVTSYTNAGGTTTTTTYVPPATSGAGAVQTIATESNSRTYSYGGSDATGRTERRSLPTSLSISGFGNLSAAYDADGQLTLQTLPGGITQSRTYDTSGRASTLSYAGQGGSWLSFARSYNATGQVEIESDGLGRTVRYGYDSAARLSSVEDAVTNAGGPVCSVRRYTFDARGNRQSVDTTTSSSCGSGNVTSASWTFDKYSRQLTGKSNAGSYQYDSLGRQTLIPASDTVSPASGDTTLAYYDNDAVARITQGGVTSSYSLDPFGRRLSVRTGATTVSNIYSDSSDNPASATQSDANGASTSRYISDLNGSLIATIDTKGSTVTRTLQFADMRGSLVATAALSSSDSATSLSSYTTFDEFGNTLQSGGSAKFGWEGSAQREVTPSGLALMGARIYNSVTGRFTSVDPIAGGNENSYVYPNDPINLHDPSGMASYNYDWRDYLGTTKSLGSAGYAWKIFKKYFKVIFPFSITGCSALTERAVCTLHVAFDFLSGVVNSTGKVRVHLVGYAMRFTVISKSYFDGPGSWVEFSAEQSGGRLYFRHKARAVNAKPIAIAAYTAGIIRQSWNLFNFRLVTLMKQYR